MLLPVLSSIGTLPYISVLVDGDCVLVRGVGERLPFVRLPSLMLPDVHARP